MKIKLIVILCFLSFAVSSQVEISEPIIMTGVTNEDRQIKGVGDPTAADHGVNVKTVQKGSLNYNIATGSNNIAINLSPSITNYVAGMIVNFMAEVTNTGPVTLTVNGLQSASIKKGVSSELDSADFKIGQFVSVIYDGTFFQVISQLTSRCPSGFVSISKDYCIEINERSTATWWQANIDCGNRNSRLCSMGEWVNACQQAGLGIMDMINNYEWVDSASNYSTTYNYHTVKTIGMDLNGVPGCDQGFWAHPTTDQKNYRCCFSK